MGEKVSQTFTKMRFKRLQLFQGIFFTIHDTGQFILYSYDFFISKAQQLSLCICYLFLIHAPVQKYFSCFQWVILWKKKYVYLYHTYSYTYTYACIYACIYGYWTLDFSFFGKYLEVEYDKLYIVHVYLFKKLPEFSILSHFDQLVLENFVLFSKIHIVSVELMIAPKQNLSSCRAQTVSHLLCNVTQTDPGIPKCIPGISEWQGHLSTNLKIASLTTRLSLTILGLTFLKKETKQTEKHVLSDLD